MRKIRTLIENARERARREEGASGLLPVVVVGLLVIMAAASVTGAVGFASNMTKEQRQITESSVASDSILQEFEASFRETLRSGAPFTASYEGDDGAYQVYYSEAKERPTDLDDSNVIELNNTVLPPQAQWLLVRVSPLDSRGGELPEDLAIYRFHNSASTAGNHSTFSAVSTLEQAANPFSTTSPAQTTVDLKNGSRIERGPGVSRNAAITDRGTGTLSTQRTRWNLRDTSSVSADVSGPSTYFYLYDKSSVRGQMITPSGGISVEDGTEFYGDLCSSFLTERGTFEGNQLATPGCGNGRPVGEVIVDGVPDMSGYATVNLTASTCNNWPALQSLLQNISTPTQVTTGNCGATNVLSDANVEKKLALKAPVMLYAPGALRNLTLEAASDQGQFTALYQTAGTLSLENFHSGGVPTVVFHAAKTLNIKNSEVLGTVLVVWKQSALNLDGSTIAYTPVDVPFLGPQEYDDIVRVS